MANAAKANVMCMAGLFERDPVQCGIFDLEEETCTHADDNCAVVFRRGRMPAQAHVQRTTAEQSTSICAYSVHDDDRARDLRNAENALN